MDAFTNSMKRIQTLWCKFERIICCRVLVYITQFSKSNMWLVIPSYNLVHINL